MPIPTLITDLSPVVASNSPAGGEPPGQGDDHLRSHAAFIRQLYDASFGRSALEVTNGVTPSNYFYPPGDIRRYGAVSGGPAGANTTAIQSAINAQHRVFVPNGTWAISASLDLLDYTYIEFESRAALLQGAIAAPLLRGKNGTTERRYRITISSGTLSNTARGTAGGVAIDFKSVTFGKVFNTEISEVETAIKNGGTGSLGAFYNEFHAVDISGVVTGYDNGTLGNDNKVFGGRVNDSVTAARDNDCSGNAYFGPAMESFTSRAFLNSDVAAATNIKYMAPRIENSAGIGFDIRALSQVAEIIAPQITAVTAPMVNLSTDANVVSDPLGWIIRGGTAITKRQSFPASLAPGSIAAGSSADFPVIISGAALTDDVSATANGGVAANFVVTGVPGTGQHYIRISNTGSVAATPPTGIYRLQVWRN